MVESKKYLLINHSGKKEGSRKHQLSMAFSGTGATLLPGKEVIVKSEHLNDHLISLGRKFESNEKGSWLQIKAYKPKAEVKPVKVDPVKEDSPPEKGARKDQKQDSKKNQKDSGK